MKKFGVNNVSGGPFVGKHKHGVDQIMSHLNDTCYNCGVYGHQQSMCKRLSFNGQSSLNNNISNNISNNVNQNGNIANSEDNTEEIDQLESFPTKKLKVATQAGQQLKHKESESMIMNEVVDYIQKLYSIFNFEDLHFPPLHNEQKMKEFEEEAERRLQYDCDWQDNEIKAGIRKIRAEMNKGSNEGEIRAMEDLVDRVLTNGYEGSH